MKLTHSTIADSGQRREFETGAVRDIQKGKGRCDLLPLGAVANLISSQQTEDTIKLVCIKDVLTYLSLFQYTKNIEYIRSAVYAFQFTEYKGDSYTSFADMILEVAQHFEDGATKYGEHNWEKGIPTHCYLDSGVRHLMKWLRGDQDERHDRAFVWNMLCLMWTMSNLPDLDDLINYTWEQPTDDHSADNISPAQVDAIDDGIDDNIVSEVEDSHSSIDDSSNTSKISE